TGIPNSLMWFAFVTIFETKVGVHLSGSIQDGARPMTSPEHRLNHNLRNVRTADVAAVSPAVGRGVLPLMLYKRLIAGAVVKEERSHCARRWVAGGEMGVDKRRRRAVCVRPERRVAMRTGVCLRHNIRNNEVPVQAAGHPIVHNALGGRAVLA